MKVLNLIACVVILAAIGCGELSGEILEAKDVLSFKVEELQAPPSVKLRLSGLAFKSSMSVREITTRTKGSAVTVSVHLVLAKAGTSGNFSYDLAVADTVNEVRFGTGAVAIWKRGTAILLPSK